MFLWYSILLKAEAVELTLSLYGKVWFHSLDEEVTCACLILVLTADPQGSSSILPCLDLPAVGSKTLVAYVSVPLEPY